MQILQSDWNRFNPPDMLAVFPNRTIRRELAHPCHIQYGHPGPFLLIVISLAHPILTVHVRLVVLQNHVLILVEQGVDKGFEQIRVFRRKKA